MSYLLFLVWFDSVWFVFGSVLLLFFFWLGVGSFVPRLVLCPYCCLPGTALETL